MIIHMIYIYIYPMLLVTLFHSTTIAPLYTKSLHTTTATTNTCTNLYRFVSRTALRRTHPRGIAFCLKNDLFK